MDSQKIRTSVRPEGIFVYGIHKPNYTVSNHRMEKDPQFLGATAHGIPVTNIVNLPVGDIEVRDADWVFEIANPLPFKGVTYINKKWADASANDPSRFTIPAPPALSLHDTLEKEGLDQSLIEALPAPLQLALATTSTDAKDLIILAELSCEMIYGTARNPIGLQYKKTDRGYRAIIHDETLFEAVANNPALPTRYRCLMVIRPGAQGDSPISAEWSSEMSHAYEYLRTNSYIAGGHYAANMAEDTVRYSIEELQTEDLGGLRRLYYQRSYIRLAEELQVELTHEYPLMTLEEIESLRNSINSKLSENPEKLNSKSTLWGWNFGFDYAPSKYRLHASHQQIHQQYAMIPQQMECHATHGEPQTDEISPYSSGDLIEETIIAYRQQYGSDYFIDYIKAIENNSRIDDRDDLQSSLIVWSDENVILFVPKAQTSQWELQLISRGDNSDRFTGNLLEADSKTRHSFDMGILAAQKLLGILGAQMVTSIEYSKKFTQRKLNQPLLYAFLPRLPESPGAFSENQLRFINGHYPEDFATACRRALEASNIEW